MACVAFRCGVPYRRALSLFNDGTHAWTRGYYCEEIVAALARAELDYGYAPFLPERDPSQRQVLRADGTIVFVEPNAAYPLGHYLIRHGSRWMNPWSNFPRMHPVEAAFQARMPGKASYIVFEIPGTVKP